jgi:hypothetical protein
MFLVNSLSKSFEVYTQGQGALKGQVKFNFRLSKIETKVELRKIE